MKKFFTLLNTSCIIFFIAMSVNLGASDTSSVFYKQFLKLCDSTVARVKNANSTEPFFVDSYGVRALCAAYDMTGNPKYLEACRSWSERMIAFQEKMIPAGAYYMNYGRKPGEGEGHWYSADCSSIAMGVLATAVRYSGTERERLIRSVESFASLVLKNYVRSSGGISDGLWPEYDGAWWCSSSLFASLSFLLYENTGNQIYLNTGLKIVDWLNSLDLTKVEPLPLTRQGPAMPMYVLEAYSAGWPILRNNVERKDTSYAQISWCFNWIKENQKIPIEQRKWKPDDWWGAKFSGLPFHQFVFSHYLPENRELLNSGDKELQMLYKLLVKNKMAKTQFGMFMMMSLAERLIPGAIYRKIGEKP